MKKAIGVLSLVVLAVGGVALAQVTADQGMPGNQGPWPVTLVSQVDGGVVPGSVQAPCTTLLSTNTSVGSSAVPVPATPLTSRIWVQVCNALLNASSTQCICAANTCPTFSVSSVGDQLNPGDCATYPITVQDAGVPCCICNAAAQRMTATECAL